MVYMFDEFLECHLSAYLMLNMDDEDNVSAVSEAAVQSSSSQHSSTSGSSSFTAQTAALKRTPEQLKRSRDQGCEVLAVSLQDLECKPLISLKK